MKLKNFTLIILFSVIQSNIYSQPTIVAQKTIGGSEYDDFTSLDLTKDGGIIVGGISNSLRSGDKTKKSIYQDYWVLKLNKENKIEWDKTIKGLWSEYFKTVKQTSDGGYILGGYSYSGIGGDKTEASRGQSDYWIVKLGSNGNIQWDKTIGGNNFDYLETIKQTTDGGYIIGGYSYSNISGEKTENSKGHGDYWIVKLDNNHNIQWDKTIGGNKYDILSALQQTTDGGYILVGRSNSAISGDKTQASKGGEDYWIVKLDGSGNIQWDKTIGGDNNDAPTTIEQTEDGGFVVGGYSVSSNSGNKTQKTRGLDDFWIVKLDASGNIQWNKTIGGASWDYLLILQQTRDEGYILGGYSNSNSSGEKTEDRKSGYDYWCVKLNRQGNVEWDKTIGGTAFSYLIDLKEIRKNQYVLGGYTASGVGYDKTDTSRGADDYWIVYLNYVKPASAIEQPLTIKQKIENVFSVYPNPAKDVLHVQTKNKTIVTLSNQSGKILFTRIVDGDETIDVSKLTPGIYYLKDDSTGNTKKINVLK